MRSLRCPAVVRGADVEAGAAALFGLLSAALALALILDQLWWGGFQLASPHVAVVAASFGVLLRPRSVARFALMVGADVVSVALDLPFVGDHRLLALVCGAGMLGYLAWTAGRTGRLPSPSVVFTAVAPLLRAAVVVLYTYAALSKLNTAFLDPATSCAAAMAPRVVWWDPKLLAGGALAEPAIWGTVTVEASLAVLLGVRRTRLAGLVLGVGFHTVLALAGNVPFSALAIAFYVAFLPVDSLARARSFLQRWPARRAGAPVSQVVVALAMAGGWLAGAAFGPSEAGPGLLVTSSAQVSGPLGDLTRLAAVAMAASGAVLIALAWRAMPGWTRPQVGAALGGRRLHPILALALATLVVNGACPYLGLKTDTAFAMFSGLRTEAGAWNSVVVPPAVRVFGYQDRPVRVVASSDPALSARTAGGRRIAPFELDRYLRSHPGTTAAVIATNGPPQRVGPLPAGTTLAERVAGFEDVPAPGQKGC